MAHIFSPEVESMIRMHMASGKYRSENDLLRDALVRLNGNTPEDEEDLQAVLEAIEELEQGDEGMELDDAFEVVRQAVEKRLKK